MIIHLLDPRVVEVVVLFADQVMLDGNVNVIKEEDILGILIMSGITGIFLIVKIPDEITEKEDRMSASTEATTSVSKF